MAKKRIYFDMDGTLCEFKEVDTLETLYEKGYFLNLQPHEGVVEAAKQFIADPDYEVFVLSAYLTDSEHALYEKNWWLDTNLPEIDNDYKIFLPCGEDKFEHVVHNLGHGPIGDLVLVDDYSANLISWEEQGGIGIKMHNGVNGAYKKWSGPRTDIYEPDLYASIKRHLGDIGPAEYIWPDEVENGGMKLKVIARCDKNILVERKTKDSITYITGLGYTVDDVQYGVVKSISWGNGIYSEIVNKSDFEGVYKALSDMIHTYSEHSFEGVDKVEDASKPKEIKPEDVPFDIDGSEGFSDISVDGKPYDSMLDALSDVNKERFEGKPELKATGGDDKAGPQPQEKTKEREI